MAEGKKKNWTLEVIATIALIYLLWLGYNKRKREAQPKAPPPPPEPTNPNPLVDPFFGHQIPCEQIMEAPLGLFDIVPGGFADSKGTCYRGDGTRYGGNPEGYGSAYAEEQAKTFEETKQAEAVKNITKQVITFKLINSTAVKAPVQVLDTTVAATPVFTPIIAPSPPATLFSSGITTSSFDANWSAVSGATGYKLDVALDSGFLSFLPGYNNKDVGSALTEAISGLTAGADYYYRLRSYDSISEGINSSISTVELLLDPPVPLPASDISDTGFTANWNASVNAAGYYLDVATDSGFTSFVAGYEDLDVGNVLTSIITGLTSETNYYYRVRAYKGTTTASSTTITLFTVAQVVIGTQTWMLKNISLNVAGSKVYNDNETNRPIYGGLYLSTMISDIETAYPGWHVPSMAEWQTLSNYLGGDTISGKHLKEVGNTHWGAWAGITNDNSSGFTAVGSGLFSTIYEKLNQNANYLTSDSATTTFFMSYQANLGQLTPSNPAYYFAVRLIKD